MKFVAKIVAGRLEMKLQFEAETFQAAYEITEQERAQQEKQLKHLGTPRIVFLRESISRK